MKFAVVAVLCGVLALAACAHQSPSTGIKSTEQTHSGDAVAMSATSDNHAHLYVFLGRIHGQLISRPNWRTSDFYINGVNVGAIDRHNCLQVELEPGVYYFAWHTNSPVWGPVKTSEAVDLLQPGQYAYLTLNIERNAGALLGPIGWWADPDNGIMVDQYPNRRDIPKDGCVLHPIPGAIAKIHPIVSATTALPQTW